MNKGDKKEEERDMRKEKGERRKRKREIVRDSEAD